MKKKSIIIISAIIIALLIIILVINKTSKKTNNINNQDDDYTITKYDGSFKISQKDCANLEEAIVQEIEDKLFCVNHNIVNTFKSTEEMTTKNYQMTVWFSKLKLDKKKSCTSKEFEQIIKDTYNVDFMEHQPLENTLEYSSGTYKLLDYEYETYIVPTIEKITQEGEATYNVYYELSNTDIQYVSKIKYMATMKMQNNNLYIESNIQCTE